MIGFVIDVVLKLDVLYGLIGFDVNVCGWIGYGDGCFCGWCGFICLVEFVLV